MRDAWRLIGTIVLGFGFLMLRYFEYSEHLRHVTPNTDSYGSIFYTIVSLHVAAPVAGTVDAVRGCCLLPQLGAAAEIAHRPYHNAAMYWHFVDIGLDFHHRFALRRFRISAICHE